MKSDHLNKIQIQLNKTRNLEINKRFQEFVKLKDTDHL